jgi:hypothetical protein
MWPLPDQSSLVTRNEVGEKTEMIFHLHLADHCRKIASVSASRCGSGGLERHHRPSRGQLRQGRPKKPGADESLVDLIGRYSNQPIVALIELHELDNSCLRNPTDPQP